MTDPLSAEQAADLKASLREATDRVHHLELQLRIEIDHVHQVVRDREQAERERDEMLNLLQRATEDRAALRDEIIEAESALTALRADHARLREALMSARVYVEAHIGAKGLTAGMPEQELVRIDKALAGAPEETGAADEEAVPHKFNSRAPYETRDARDVWCTECEYHRDHQIHAASAEPTKEPR